MGRQLTLDNHCLLCLKDVTAPFRAYHAGNSKVVYERVPGSAGFSHLAKICDACLGFIRGGNWPTEVYAKLSGGQEPEGERASKRLAEKLLTA